MIDLETTGTRPGCRVLSIGAFGFSKDGQQVQFYRRLRIAEQAYKGLVDEPATLEWWRKQAADVRDEAFSGQDGTFSTSSLTSAKAKIFRRGRAESISISPYCSTCSSYTVTSCPGSFLCSAITGQSETRSQESLPPKQRTNRRSTAPSKTPKLRCAACGNFTKITPKPYRSRNEAEKVRRQDARRNSPNSIQRENFALDALSDPSRNRNLRRKGEARF